MTLQRNARIWVHREQWLPAIILAIREPGMRASDVSEPGNNGKLALSGPWVEAVCAATTEAGAFLVSYPEDSRSREWLPLTTPTKPSDPRTWDIWDAATCEPEGSTPLHSVKAESAVLLSAYREGADNGGAPIFLRVGRFSLVEPVDARFRYNLCTVRPT